MFKLDTAAEHLNGFNTKYKEKDHHRSVHGSLRGTIVDKLQELNGVIISFYYSLVGASNSQGCRIQGE